MAQPMTTTIPIRDRSGNVVDEKEVVTYAGLLARAHEEGLVRIETKLLVEPTADNGGLTIAFATVETAKGTFTGIGDASPDNVNRMIAPHSIRMAETRAKARALRDAVNVGIVALEELGGDEPLQAPEPSNVRALPDRRPAPERPTANDNSFQRRNTQATNDSMTLAQRKLLLRILAEDGYEGEAATAYLCELAGVERVDQISKRTASGLIDRARGGGERRHA